MQVDETKRQSHWTDSIAVGSKSFIEEVKMRLGFKVKARSMAGGKGHYHLKVNVCNFGSMSLPGFESVAASHSEMLNTFLWDDKS